MAELSKSMIRRAQRIIQNKADDNKRAKEIANFIDKKFDVQLEKDDILYAADIVKGKVVENGGELYLKIEGHSLAKANGEGCFCHQVCQFEDCYSGELYFRIDDETFLQVGYNC